MFIGFYGASVILTYIGLAFAVVGMALAFLGHIPAAIMCLILSGVCDMFDGKIARTKKDRTEDEKKFGIQIDSLCDIVCFGILPMVICYKSGMKHMYSIVILVLYGLAGLVRLAHFNVMEEKRQE